MDKQPTSIKSIWSTFRYKGIGRRFTLYILLFSSIVTLFITFIQLFNDYRQDIIAINRTLQQIGIIYRDTLSTAIWVHNQTGINLQLDGMMRLPSILYVQVDNELGEKLEHRGTLREHHTLKNSFELSYVHREKKIFLGKLNVLADLDAVYNRLLKKVVIIFISQGIKTFLVSLFIILLFYMLVGRFLLTMAKVARKISEGSYSVKLEIGRDDELSDVSASFNDMTSKLVTNMEVLKKEVNVRCQAQQALEEHKKNLEDLVHEKTCDFINTNKALHSTNKELQKEILERRQAEEKIAASLHEKEILLKEIHHRVKNNLQIISSLLKLQANSIKDEQVKESFRESQQRIVAMASVHTQLYESQNLAAISFADYVQDMTRQLLQACKTDTAAIGLVINIEEIMLPIHSAIPCGLLINELITNALKYAFPEARKGEITIEAQQTENGVRLIFADNGIGLPNDVDFHTTETLGLRLVQMLVKQLDGSIELSSEKGTRYVIQFKPATNQEIVHV